MLAMDPAAIGQAMRDTFGQLAELVQRHGLVVSGPPRAIYTSYSADSVSFTVALPLDTPPAIPTDWPRSRWATSRTAEHCDSPTVALTTS